MTKKQNAYNDLDAWRRLFDATIRMRDLAPWTFADEDQVIAIDAGPQCDTLYVSVMGACGQHHAVAVYLGSEGLNGFWRAHCAPEFSNDIADTVLQTPHLQAIVASRNELDDWDRGLVKAVGLNPRGTLAWPYFRSYRPGMHPWRLDAAEIAILETALLQLLAVGERLATIPMGEEPPQTYLTRIRVAKDGEAEWREEQRPAPARQSVICGNIRQDLIDRVSALPTSDADVAADLFVIPHGVQDRRDERPYFPHLLVLVDPLTGRLLDQRLLTPMPHFETMLCSLPERALEMLCTMGCRPRRMLLLYGHHAEIATPALEKAGINVVACDEIPALRQCREYMQGIP